MSYLSDVPSFPFSKKQSNSSFVLPTHTPFSSIHQQQDSHSSKDKETKALRRFEEIFKKEYITQKQIPKKQNLQQRSTCQPEVRQSILQTSPQIRQIANSKQFLRKSPQIHMNKLKGMFLIRQKYDLQVAFDSQQENKEKKTQIAGISMNAIQLQKKDSEPNEKQNIQKTKSKNKEMNQIKNKFARQIKKRYGSEIKNNHHTNQKKSAQKDEKKMNFIVERKSHEIRKSLKKYKNSQACQNFIFNSNILNSLVLRANNSVLITSQDKMQNPSQSQTLPQQNFAYFNVYIEEGNNSQMVKTAIRRRSGWRVVESPSNANMIWSQFYRQQVDFRLRRNRIGKQTQTFHQQSQKGQILQESYFNSINHQYSIKYNEKFYETLSLKKKTFQQNPKLPWVMKRDKKNNNSLLEQKHIKKDRKKSQEAINYLSAQAYSQEMKKICPDFQHFTRKVKHCLTISHPKFFYNHIPNHHTISDKNNLLQNLKNYYFEKNKNIFNVLPFSVQCTHLNDLAALNSQQDGFWIIKPGENSNRGRGIVVCENLISAAQEIGNRLKQVDDEDKKQNKNEGGKKVSCSVIVQKYIEPLLYNNRKFDIRVYLMVTLVHGKMRGYLYEEGYLRTCSRAFTMSSTNRYIHLTNDAVQSKSPDYGKYEEGNKLSWKKFQIWVQNEVNQHFFPKFKKQVKNICHDILSSAQSSLKKKYLKNQKNDQNSSMDLSQGALNQKNKIYYELFGLDFMIGKDFKVWLIEVNTNPALTTQSSRVTTSLIPKLINNVFTIAVDPFLKPQRQSQTTKFQNNFTVIYDDQWENQVKAEL